MAYSPLRRVSDLIVEIYDGIHFPHTRFGDMKRNLLQKEIGAVDAKYISDISSIAKQKEKEMRLLQAYTKCRTGKTDDKKKLQCRFACPDSLCGFETVRRRVAGSREKGICSDGRQHTEFMRYASDG